MVGWGENVGWGKWIFWGIVEEEKKGGVVLVEMDVIEGCEFLGWCLGKERVGEWGGFRGKCREIVVEVDGGVWRGISGLMRGEFVVGVEDEDFLSIKVEM